MITIPKPHVLSVSESIAHGIRLAGVETFVSYPTKYTQEFASTLKGVHKCGVIHSDSFGAALNAALGSEIGGKRTFVLSSVPNSVEDMHALSYTRLPIVAANISRSVGIHSIRCDHSDILAARDAGWIIFMPESNQELVGSIIQAYRVSEELMLPSFVNIDMPFISESVMLPSDQYVRKFVPKLRISTPKTYYLGVPLDEYIEAKKKQHKAACDALHSISKSSELWKKNTKRDLPAVEPYRLEDADYAVVIAGYHSPTAKASIDKLRASGVKAGLLRIRVIRPLPSDQIMSALANVKKTAVVDQGVSIGLGGIIWSEMARIASHLYSFVSLGNHLSEKHFSDMIEHIAKSSKEETVWI